MSELILDNDTSKNMREHALATFPEECCGFMFGSFNDDRVKVNNVKVVNNTHPDHRSRRFLISPEDYMNAEKYADKNSLALVGVYHSHPNHPAMPSETDRLSAMPGFTYIIYSIMDGEPADVRAWVLDEDRSKFSEVEIVYKEE